MISIIIYQDIPRLLWIINRGSDSWGPDIPWIPLQSPSRFQSAHWVSAFGHERHGGFQQKSRRPGDGFKPIQTEGNWDQLVLEQYYTFGVDIHYKSGKNIFAGKNPHVCWPHPYSSRLSPHNHPRHLCNTQLGLQTLQRISSCAPEEARVSVSVPKRLYSRNQEIKF